MKSNSVQDLIVSIGWLLLGTWLLGVLIDIFGLPKQFLPFVEFMRTGYAVTILLGEWSLMALFLAVKAWIILLLVVAAGYLLWYDHGRKK